MKRSVSKELRVTFTIGFAAWVVAQFVHAEETEFIALLMAGFAVYLLFAEPPVWLRHSPIGRWLRR